jgi:hypothetical protein
LPHLDDAKDASVVEARAVVDQTARVALGEDAVVEGVVVARAAIVTRLELGDVGICHVGLLVV